VPALRLKQDILPDRYTYLWFKANRTGIFHFTCAEFCGTDHSVMAGRMVIQSPEDYARWTAAQPEGDDLAHQGSALFRSLGCSGCHSVGSTVHAPDLHGIYGHAVQLADGSTVTADEAYLRDCILLPDKARVAGFPPLMPNFSGSVSEGQLIELVAYLKSLTTDSNGGVEGALQ
jgi:cytochrome c oxidase subunit 2